VESSPCNNYLKWKGEIMEYVRLLVTMETYRNTPWFVTTTNMIALDTAYNQAIKISDNVDIMGYVFLPTRAVFIIEGVDKDIQKFIDLLMSETESNLRIVLGKSNNLPIWHEFCTSIPISSPASMKEAQAYMYKMPCVHGLVKRPGDYRWSDCKEVWKDGI
jgi:hypothetical protein